VQGFKRWLIFYLERPGAIEILRVLHGARDLEALFGEAEE
jgi:plasmid stabilization system protein ParE